MAARHLINACVVENAATIIELMNAVLGATGQCFKISNCAAPHTSAQINGLISDALFFHSRAIDVHDTLYHLDAIPWQAHDTLDVICGVVLGQLEHRHIAAFGFCSPHAPAERNGAEGKGMLRIAIAVFGDK
jgi:hypothetical protein